MVLNNVLLFDIENELKIKLPEYYKDFHLSQIELILKLRKLEADDMLHLSTNPNCLKSHNRDLFEFSQNNKYLENKFCIGTDGCGNDSFMSFDENDKNFYFLDHESVEQKIAKYKFDATIYKNESKLSNYVFYFIDVIEKCIRENSDEMYDKL